MGILTVQILLLPSLIKSDLVVDWSTYPSGAVNCLNQAQGASKCPSDNVPDFNGCVCKNGNNFLQNAATCLGSGDAGDLDAVYSRLATNCGGTSIPISVSQQQWDSWAGSGSKSSSTSTVKVTQPPSTATSIVTLSATNQNTLVSTLTVSPTSGTSPVTSVITLTPGQTTTLPAVVTLGGSSPSSSPSSSPTPSPSGGGSKLGTGAIVGIAVGVPAFLAIVGLLGFLIFRLTRHKKPNNVDGSTVVPSNNSEFGPSPGMAAVEAYKNDRPVSSIPSASPDPTKRYSTMSRPSQGPYNATSPTTGQFGAVPFDNRYSQQGQYPPGQYPQETTAQNYNVSQPYPQQGYGQPHPNPGYQQPPGGYSELSSETVPHPISELQASPPIPGGHHELPGAIGPNY